MDLSTTPRRGLETSPRRGLETSPSDLQKTRVAKSVFSIRSLVDIGDTDLPIPDEITDLLNGELIHSLHGRSHDNRDYVKPVSIV